MKKIFVGLSVFAFLVYGINASAMVRDDVIDSDKNSFSITSIENENVYTITGIEDEEVYTITSEEDLYTTTSLDGEYNTTEANGEDVKITSEDGVIKITSDDSNNIIENVIFGTAGFALGSLVTYYVVTKKR